LYQQARERIIMSRIASKNTPEQYRERMELRRSGAAGKHADRRDRRVRTRSASKARSLREFA
jgi:hypothetical protein